MLLSSLTFALVSFVSSSSALNDQNLIRKSNHVAQSKRFHVEEPTHDTHLWKRTMGPAWTSKPVLKQSKYTTGVSAMQLTVVGEDHVLVIDKSENNPLQIKGTGEFDKGKTHPAWVNYLNYKTGKSIPLQSSTNSFCAGGSWLSNGTFMSIGGNPAVNKASYYDQNGITALRLFKQCDNSRCDIYENSARVRLASARWYPSGCRLQDGSISIWGGMTAGGFNNVEATDNPTVEYFPSKSFNNGLPLYSKFLHDSLNSNLFPILILLPSGSLFVGANERAMIYDWQKNKETMLPDVPNGVRMTYPFSAASVLLPLTIANKWNPEVLLCGGSTINDRLNAYKMSSKTAASKQCSRLDLSSGGIKKGWQIENMKVPRIMGDAILTPDGKVVVVNGARSGVADHNVHDVVGQSNADGPDYSGFIYDPVLAKGKRISYDMPKSTIARMYHSVATMTASGDILIAGSNPNVDVSTAVYQTEYRIELLSPPYRKASAVKWHWCPAKIPYGKHFAIIIDSLPSKAKVSDISIVLMDYGYHTHAVGSDQRLVELSIVSFDTKTKQVMVKTPSKPTYFPPGIGWLHPVYKGVPGSGCRVMVGNGDDPPFDKAAYENMMEKTKRSHGAVIY